MTRMNGTWTFLGGLGLGTGLMYLLDPNQGRRRRAMLKDKAIHGLNAERSMLSKGARDLSHRASGAMRRLRSPTSENVSDEVLVQRVRASMGRYASHPSAIEVTAADGHVRLRGPIFADEIDELVEVVRNVPGVRWVDSDLEGHSSPAGIPALQGERRRRARTALQREVWPPSVRLAASGSGAALALYGVRRGGVTGTAAALAGAAMLVRATTNLTAKRLFGVNAGHRAVDLEKTVVIHAPIEEVFRFATDIENFPRFMRHVKDVRASERNPDQSHWKVQGPGGITLSWNAEVRRRDPNHTFAWKTLPGAVVDHAGIMTFTEDGPDATRIQIRMSYNPPAGAIGHAVLRLLGSDPKRALNEDFVRLKSLLEDGKTRVHGERVEAQELH